ncbi:hypothetical protein ACWD04_20585 [Streptomyces sp. NPDC002911]
MPPRPTERTRLLTGLIRRNELSAHAMNRLHLLAAACLEHATELAPAVRVEVQERAGALIEVGPVTFVRPAGRARCGCRNS